MKYPRRRYVALRVVLALGVLLVPGPGALAAQGILFVRVSARREPVANATVDLMLLGTVIRRAGTDEKGVASMTGLPSGTFEVRIEALGYRPHMERAVRVESGSSTVLEVDLETSPIPLEGLTVKSERVQIQRENTEFSTRVDEAAIELPPLTLDAGDLVSLTPGARPGHVWGGASFQGGLIDIITKRGDNGVRSLMEQRIWGRWAHAPTGPRVWPRTVNRERGRRQDPDLRHLSPEEAPPGTTGRAFHTPAFCRIGSPAGSEEPFFGLDC